ncbi:MAG: Dam family site-specific DNA-(adenine-N6)-methyltransferase [Proteobacteria bacterium]|nr:Dam family site-specific DNA-(adenine-N6)-methyltransferase [Pseudomonadota bacterium]
MSDHPKGNSPILVPFLKWAGGKRWLFTTNGNLFPDKFNYYFEPFLGSGAVFFHLRPDKAVLADRNADLINVYEQIYLNWEKVFTVLKRHGRNHNNRYYYAERARQRKVGHERAAQFIYLNRVCWNGLYRVNLRGQFNVPIGTKTSVMLDTDNFAGAAQLLKRAAFSTSDFEPILAQSQKNDFVFVDPPYVTRHNFNGFVKYNDKIFSWNDQERLASAVAAAAARGTKILLTNANHISIRKLYQGLGTMVELKRNSVLAGDTKNRGSTTELAIVINYEIGSKQ